MDASQAAALREPFPKSAIGKLPRGGIQLDYVGHAAVTNRLLEVDPEWTWEPVAFGPDGLPALDRFGGLWIRLTVAGVTRLGYGEATGKQPSAQTVKELISDALRNAAMRFGVALDLWSKEDLHVESSPQPIPGTGKPMTAEELQRRLGPEFVVTDRNDGEVLDFKPRDQKATQPKPEGDSRKRWKASEKQINAVIAVGHSVGLHDAGSLLPALSALVGRPIHAYADLTGNDVDLVLKDKGDALCEIVNSGKAAKPHGSTDDPWGSDTATPQQVARIRALFAELTTPVLEQRSITHVVADRDVDRLEHLTSVEADRLIAHLNGFKGDTA